MATAAHVQPETVIDAIFHPDVAITDAVALAQRLAKSNPSCLLKMLTFAEGGGDTDILRLLNCLEQMEPSSEMQHVLRLLLFQTRGKIQSKAALILGRKFPDACWFTQWARHVQEQRDPRVRANAIESLWGLQSQVTEEILRQAVHDTHHRVVVNALLGLHMLADEQCIEALRNLTKHESSDFRSAAAYAMGEIGDAQFLPELKALICDSTASVRTGAVRAVMKIQRAKVKA